jgi:hypothetical protein
MARRKDSLCGKCKLEDRVPGQAWCRPCRNAYMRANRPKHSELSDENRRKANTRSYTNVLLGRGKLAQAPCENCGSPEAEKHHPDYENPRLVKWLCVECHRSLHEEETVAVRKLKSTLLIMRIRGLLSRDEARTLMKSMRVCKT